MARVTRSRNPIRLAHLVLCTSALLGGGVRRLHALQGQLVFDTVRSLSLGHNKLGDSSSRSVIIYLPPSYQTSNKRYPTVYLLHGNGAHNTLWINGRLQGLNIQTAMDSLVRNGVIHEMILVMPDANNRYGGSHYANSSVAGNWSDFITDDLVQHVDRAYRTLASPNSRGLAGHSMGGRGTLNIALKHPGAFGAIYAMSAGRMGFETFAPVGPEYWSKALQMTEVQTSDPEVIRIMSFATAFSPNAKRPPLLVDFPYELVGGELRTVQPIWLRWLENDPVYLAPTLAHNLARLRGIHFDAGTSDVPIVAENRLFSAALERQGIAHVFEEYDGDHNNRIGERVIGHVLPFFSESLISN